MNISILLPYKENFSKNYAGAVSIFVNDTNKLSSYKKTIRVYGFTNEKKKLDNYKNINIKKKFFSSTSSQYINNFLKTIKKEKIDILEVHNRPHYIKFLKKIKKTKIILYFHNDPLKMQGSVNQNERLELLKNTDKIIFNSNWSKSRFLIDLPKSIYDHKIDVVHQSTSKTSVNFKKKEKIISFVGKLNESKGYDIFGKSIIKILNKHKEWSAFVIGDEPRQKFFFNHPNLHHYGFKDNKFVLNMLKKVSIAVVPSRWDEPFGRSSLEAASRGCALIISNTGGLSETTNDALILDNISAENLYGKIETLIKDNKLRKNLQINAHKNFTLTNKKVSNQIDKIRENLINKNINILTKTSKILKIIHITNLNERFDGRLHYNTGKRINNGLIRLGHNVLNISDRDIISNYKNLRDPKGIKTLNKKIISSFINFNPDLILMGHADNVTYETLDLLKNLNKSLKISQWFLDPVTKFGPDYINNKKRLIKFDRILDANFITTDPYSIDFKIKNPFFIPNPADEAFETLDNYKYDCEKDLFFAMSHGVHRGTLKKGKFDDREIILRRLIENNKNIKFDFYGLNGKQPIWGDNFKKILSNSKMGLNLSRGKPIKYYSSDRISQLMGNGLLTFIDEKICYSDFFNNKELVTYKNYSDLVEKINKYKKDDKQRKLIAKNAKKKYLKFFNSRKVAKFILNKTFQINNKEKFLWY